MQQSVISSRKAFVTTIVDTILFKDRFCNRAAIVTSHRCTPHILLHYHSNTTTMKFSSFAIAAVAIAASSVNAFSTPNFSVRQVCL